MATLYRKYRPQSFSEVLGQNHIKTTLENEIKSGEIAQAYIFCGPRAVGKTTLARILAKAVNCNTRKSKESEPCNKCTICTNIEKGKSLEVIEIDAASHTGVDNVRENIISAARVAPSSHKYKVFIIDEVHMLSISAFNALLKLIEEPPKHAMFILCTTEIHKVPATVISRCQRFDFKRMSLADTVKKLQYILDKEGLKADKKILETIGRQANGYLRDAESLLGQVVSLASGKTITEKEALLILPNTDLHKAVEYLQYLSKNEPHKAISLINELVDAGVDLKSFTGDLIQILRKMMMDKINPGFSQTLGLDFGQSLEKEIAEVLEGFDTTKISQIIETLIIAQNDLKNTQITQLPLELATVKLSGSSRPSEISQTPVTPKPVPQPQPKKTIENDNDKPATPTPPSVTTPEPSVSQPTNTSKGTVKLQDIKKNWKEFLIYIRKDNHSLSFILQNCVPEQVEGNLVTLAFKYKFHADRINDMAIKIIVEKALGEIFKSQLTLITRVDEKLRMPTNTSTTPAKEETPNQNPAQKGALNNLLNAFGGEVIS